jgi:hypothetical protein
MQFISRNTLVPLQAIKYIAQHNLILKGELTIKSLVNTGTKGLFLKNRLEVSSRIRLS